MYSIFLFCSQGLDEISYGGRRSRRGSVSDTTTYSYASRRGSVSTSADYAALITASAAAQEATTHYSNTKTNAAEKQNGGAENNHPESGLGNSPKSINLSRQNSTRQVFF